jgi:hypothetical protein
MESLPNVSHGGSGWGQADVDKAILCSTDRRAEVFQSDACDRRIHTGIAVSHTVSRGLICVHVEHTLVIQCTTSRMAGDDPCGYVIDQAILWNRRLYQELGCERRDHRQSYHGS